jgi:hypothetical protein
MRRPPQTTSEFLDLLAEVLADSDGESLADVESDLIAEGLSPENIADEIQAMVEANLSYQKGVLSQPIICYHGTASNNIESFQAGIRFRVRQWSKGRAVFCASLSFQVACQFALRKTPMMDLDNPGIILEFHGDLREGIEFFHNTDPTSLHDEKEIAICEGAALKLERVWRFANGAWCSKI